MREVETIIVGGGPAGSSCARELLTHGRACLVLERKAMPRPKLCAGWITPRVLEYLGIQPGEYPHGMLPLERIRVIFGRGRRFSKTIRTRQYSIRRVQFDAWLLARSHAEVVLHTVRQVRREGDAYVIDDAFRCRHLVGAGGTTCPVKRTFFPAERGRLIITREVEYECAPRQPVCTLWFPFASRFGYAWYVPKADAVNLGYGGPHEQFAHCDHKGLWRAFVALLKEQGCIESDPPEPKGHPYYLGDLHKQVKRGSVYLVGDAAGLATLDLAEGIGPAVQSGILAARDIILGLDVYASEMIARHSLGPLARALRRLITVLP